MPLLLWMENSFNNRQVSPDPSRKPLSPLELPDRRILGDHATPVFRSCPGHGLMADTAALAQVRRGQAGQRHCGIA